MTSFPWQRESFLFSLRVVYNQLDTHNQTEVPLCGRAGPQETQEPVCQKVGG